MKINIKELKPTIKLVEDKNHPDLLAYVSLKFVDEHERNFIVNGFTLRKSKYDGEPYLAIPSKKMPNGSFFKFVLIEKSLWREIEKEVISRYEYETIPVIEEE
ncbi:hypothetical protein J7L36_02500 [bacterium]|nr:hypothetical protein [bacterium]